MRLIHVLDLLAVALLGWLTARMAWEPVAPSLLPASRNVIWYFPALFAFSTFTVQTLWLGQVSLLGATALQAAWYLDRKGHAVLGGVCLALASIKPQPGDAPDLVLARAALADSVCPASSPAC